MKFCAHPASRSIRQPGLSWSRALATTFPGYGSMPNTAAERSARDINAHAYTVRQIQPPSVPASIAPGTAAGNRLIAHELTHVVQQSTT